MHSSTCHYGSISARAVAGRPLGNVLTRTRRSKACEAHAGRGVAANAGSQASPGHDDHVARAHGGPTFTRGATEAWSREVAALLQHSEQTARRPSAEYAPPSDSGTSNLKTIREQRTCQHWTGGRRCAWSPLISRLRRSGVCWRYCWTSRHAIARAVSSWLIDGSGSATGTACARTRAQEEQPQHYAGGRHYQAFSRPARWRGAG